MRSSAAKALSVGIVATLSAAGLAWHECVLLAAGAAVGHRLFLWRMDDGAPWDAWRAGVRCLFAGLSKAVRAELGVELNDEVTATIELDTAERTVEIPAALTEALAADPVARERFEALAFTHRKEYAVWIAEAKKEETRARRVTQALEMLREGKTRS